MLIGLIRDKSIGTKLQIFPIIVAQKIFQTDDLNKNIIINHVCTLS